MKSKAPLSLDLESLARSRTMSVKVANGQLKLMLDTVETDRFGTSWNGKVESGGYFTFTRRNGIVNGDIATARGHWQVKTLSSGAFELREIDQAYIQSTSSGEDSFTTRLPARLQASPANACSTGGSPSNVIDFAVYFTPDAKAAAGGLAQIEAEAYHAVVVTNQTFTNSGVTTQLNPVVIREIPVSEAQPDYQTMVSVLNDISAQTAHPVISADKAQYDFDAGMVLIQRSFLDGAMIISGAASRRNSQGGFDAPAYDSYYSDFASVGWASRYSATADYSFPHEIGHILGAAHNCEANLPFPLYPSSHGYCASNGTLTIMTDHGSCPSPTRLPVWSNGIPPTGSPGGACFAKMTTSLANFTPRVSAYECSNQTFSGAMIKDTWTDDGSIATVGAQVPGIPGTANNPYVLYDSVDVWNRQQNDGQVHINQQQNVERGQDNFVNVRLRNGGPAALNGTIEVYYAEANVNFVLADFTLVGTTAVTIPANATKISTVPWLSAQIPVPSSDNPSGHFCLYVKWVSAGDPNQTTEGTDVAANVAYNNNIAWKNLNIVNLIPLAPPTSGGVLGGALNLGSVGFRNTAALQSFEVTARNPDGVKIDISKDYTVALRFDERTRSAIETSAAGKPSRVLLSGGLALLSGPRSNFSFKSADSGRKGWTEVFLVAKRRRAMSLSGISLDLELKSNGRIAGGYRFSLR